MIYYVILMVMTIIGAIASYFLKKASSSDSIKRLLFNINLYIGIFLYIVSAILNIYVLRYLEYSVVLPLTAITYVWTMVISYLFLKEKITLKKVMGTSLIIVGAICLAV